MKLVIFGLTVSSSWGNGHATLWRGLIRALARRGWTLVFFERDVPYYASARDLQVLEGGRLVLYRDWDDVRSLAEQELGEADVAIVTSYCPDAGVAADLVSETGHALRVFYDLDTPVTLAHLRAGNRPDYIAPEGLGDYDLVLSYTGGRALEELRTSLGARRTAALYGHVDPERYRPGAARSAFTADLSYLGTYAADRQADVERLFVQPALARPDLRFVIGGAQYPREFPWSANIYFVRHLPPADHPDFYASSRLTLNVTRRAMAEMGWCPSGRLFEAAACGTAIITDVWEGLDDFFQPGEEIIAVRSTSDVIAALDLGEGELRGIGANARDRVLSEHTSDNRASELERLLSSVSATEQRSTALEAW